ncbi:MAG: 2-isopropylmalate synthase [Gammaproteobacteria bacterium TMED104]|nr:MAG: 2-isopropylmalate synthase [Gammaproteobacteria bacterium TMED104]
MKDIAKKYKPFSSVELRDRTWPDKKITKAPIWCSVDLRDGNQALIEPMGHEKKVKMFELLCSLGFKEIEIGFPAASQTDYDFVRYLIEEKKIPNDVTIQVLTQSRQHIIEKTFESLIGIDKAIVHFYNSTSALQRKVVFDDDKEGIKKIAIDGALLIKELSKKYNKTNWRFEYSPESFTGTEVDFAAEVCNEVVNILKPYSDEKIIINLPATVEMSSPNVYGDQIEWMIRNLNNREDVIVSLHPHNDRGTAVGAAEIGVMAGADRVEGTLFGNGERTGNVDIVTLALNLLTQGVDPKLELNNINHVIREVEYCNQLPVHPRHPYAGDLVFTAFSGSHQDAIKKGLSAISQSNNPHWEVPYLPIDPSDLGRTYEAVVRINSQSGKGGIAYILEKDHGVSLPRRLQISLSTKIQKVADETGKELLSHEIWDIFDKNFIQGPNKAELVSFELNTSDGENDSIKVEAKLNQKKLEFSGSGNGPIDAMIQGINKKMGLNLSVTDYHQHSLGTGSDAKAVAYIEVSDGNKTRWGVGIDENTIRASLRAIMIGFDKISI